jgi:hypothetical protein
MADVPIMVQALQAKVIARLLSPAKLPWMEYATHWIATTDKVGVGLASLFAGTGHGRLSMPKRLLGYLTAFTRLQCHRLQPASTLTFQQAMREPLFNNRQILGSDGRPLAGNQWLAVAGAGVRRVQDLRDYMTGARMTGGRVTSEMMEELMERLPLPWRALVEGPAAAQEWLVSEDGSEVCRVVGELVTEQYKVMDSGRLLPAEHVMTEVPALGWRDCLVLSYAASKAASLPTPQQPGGPQDEVRPASLFCVGPWCEVQVDPSVWGIGRDGVLQYKVSAAADRLKTLRMLAECGATYVVGHGLRPKVWQDDWSVADGGLAEAESKWTAAVHATSQARQRQAGHRATSRRRPLLEDDMQPYQVGAPWMCLQVSRPRLHPLDRTAQRQPAEQAAPRMIVADDIDVAAAQSGAPPRWQGVWERAHDSDLDREVRTLGWRLLHCCLNVGARRVYMHSLRAATEASTVDGLCSHPSCQAQPETLSHVFVLCPVAMQVTHWLCDVWHVITGGNRPPRTPAVLLADDTVEWDPGPQMQKLWTLWRLTTLSAIWAATTKRNKTGAAVNATGIAATVVFQIRLLMQRDWQLVEVDIRLHSGMCNAWFRGRAPSMTIEGYVGKWCCGGVLATAPTGGQGRPIVKPRIRLSAMWPVPLPGLRFPSAPRPGIAVASSSQDS